MFNSHVSDWTNLPTPPLPFHRGSQLASMGASQQAPLAAPVPRRPGGVIHMSDAPAGSRSASFHGHPQPLPPLSSEAGSLSDEVDSNAVLGEMGPQYSSADNLEKNDGSRKATSSSKAAGGNDRRRIRKQVPCEVTTVMIRNLTGEITTQALVEQLCRFGLTGKFDFCYVPCDYATGQGKGFGFVNFTSSDVAHSFISEWHGLRQLGTANLRQPLNISAAEVQGIDANLAEW
eukprot:CAMPEP_0206487288 /NCGR_PEP_ID=MMETSP0324_2-20121206/41536_1 /ASSEMBLY_ACC=CAM_ASM_000836 /TAXON_ID=2866 /ORGANISM="Crypthecodinium cohnii, Strain Seligo" /LENGTH=231 /DNA_ID=CAMNT_0053965709 /DNA_START=357 /DNA_END=1049 /DNA_ORIENTATION=-